MRGETSYLALLIANVIVCNYYSATAIMFRSHAVRSQWDTWAFVENGTYYAYYLVTSTGNGDGFGVAISQNGATGWNDQGFVWHHDNTTSPTFTGWEGTGAVWRKADFNNSGKYVINFSQCPRNGLQNISFATSTDLIHWHDAEDQVGWFDIDERYYDNPGRWDCIYSFPFPNSTDPRAGPRYGAWTATPNQSLTPNSIWGFGYTLDGLRWTALPSPKIEWGSVAPFGAEMGAIERLEIGNTGVFKYYALVGHCCNHMNTFIADDDPATGIWRPATRNFFVLFGDCYFARFFRDEATGDVLVTHQSAASGGWGGPRYISPYKLALVDTQGVLRFHWWPVNAAFKGRMLDATVNGSTGTLDRLNYDRTKGVLIECTVQWQQPQMHHHADVSGNNTFPGFRLQFGPTPASPSSSHPPSSSPISSHPPSSSSSHLSPSSLPSNQAIVIDRLGRGVTGYVSDEGGLSRNWLRRCSGTECPGFTGGSVIDHALDLNATTPYPRARLRLLLRNDKLEMYANDVLLQVYGGVRGSPDFKIGILQPKGVAISAIEAWEMDLPSDGITPDKNGFKKFPGALRSGHDLRVANTTADMAEIWCQDNNVCGGFTLRVSNGSKTVSQVYFKDMEGSLQPNSDPEWESYVKVGL